MWSISQQLSKYDYYFIFHAKVHLGFGRFWAYSLQEGAETLGF